MNRDANQIAYDFDFITPIDECIKPDNLLIPSLDIMMERIIDLSHSKFNIDLIKRKMV